MAVKVEIVIRNIKSRLVLLVIILLLFLYNNYGYLFVKARYTKLLQSFITALQEGNPKATEFVMFESEEEKQKLLQDISFWVEYVYQGEVDICVRQVRKHLKYVYVTADLSNSNSKTSIQVRYYIVQNIYLLRDYLSVIVALKEMKS
jgi:hypothetical protein